MRKKVYFTTMLIGTMLLAACGNISTNTTQPASSESVGESAAPSNVQELTIGVAPPFDLQWGESLEDCGAKFGNDWTLQGSSDEIMYCLNQKQTLFGKEGMVVLNFLKRPESETAPKNLLTLPDYFLESVSIGFECPASEIEAELVKQYGNETGRNEIEMENAAGEKIVTTQVGFSTASAQVKNITNENQKKAYYTYHYIVEEKYRDIQEVVNLPMGTIQEHQKLYNTNPDELWNQIKGWNFNDGEEYLNGITLQSTANNPNACTVTYSLGKLAYILNVQ